MMGPLSVDMKEEQRARETVSLKEYTTALIEALQRSQDIHMTALQNLLKERYDGQEKAAQQRYDAQEKAGAVAFTAQQTALTTGLLTAERGVETALAAAKEATTKAEVNATARFEQFRSESGLQLKTLSDKLDTEIGRVSERISEMAARLNTGTGERTGAADTRNTARLDMGQMLVAGGFLVAIVVAVMNLFQ